MRLSEKGNLQALFIKQFSKTLAQIRDIKYIRQFPNVRQKNSLQARLRAYL